MLDLGSPRWSDLRSHFGDGAAVARVVGAWERALGTRAEEATYDVLFEHYLHQLTIMSCAYAVVPHVVAAVPRVPAAARLNYLAHVAHVEMSRLEPAAVEAQVALVQSSDEVPDELREHFVKSTRDRCPELPADLRAGYLAAVAEAKGFAKDLLSEAWAPRDFARLLGLLTGLFARDQSKLAGALLHPEGLSLESEYEGRASLAGLLTPGPSRRHFRQ